ncbi:MAG TPA: universal stress protein [Thermodesulfovibrionales bacterium]|nr:universal stress protein [Thermodesulfovibrionales bacterium]
MKNILIAIDDSPCALRAVGYVGQQFSGMGDLEITLFHVLPYVPAGFWDDGHILTAGEREERKKVVDRWLSNQTLKLDPLFREAVKILTGKGIGQERITIRSVSDSTDVAGSILEEAQSGGYQTLVMGRCGRSQAERRLMGSVTTKVVNHGAGIAVCIVE